MKWIVRLIALLVVASTVGLATLVLDTRSSLDKSQSAVANEWTELRPDIVARYVVLADANNLLRDSGGPSRTIVSDIDAALREWDALVEDESDLADQLHSANELEGLARRLDKVVTASPQTQTEQQLAALVDFANLKVDASVINELIEKYQSDLDGSFAKLLAGSLGFEELPALVS